MPYQQYVLTWRLVSIGAPCVMAAAFWLRAAENDQIGMDFRLTYTIAAAWLEGLDAYDDTTLKSVWARRGDPRATPPGLPQTPNVYPLTIAPVLAPLALLKYPAAHAAWLTINAACVASMLYVVLAIGRGSIASVLVFAVLLLGFPLHYGFSFGNLAVLSTCCLFHSIRLRERDVPAGLLLGVSLLKYTLSGPIALLFLFQRRSRLLAVAAAVQVALLASATIGTRTVNPIPWITAMHRNALASLQPGEINHYAGLDHTALHLELANLLYRISPGLDRAAPLITTLLVMALIGGLVRQGLNRRDKPGGSSEPSIAYIAILAVTLLAFYHRTYDLIVVLIPLACWLASATISRAGVLCWVGFVLASLPGATVNGGRPSDVWWITVVVQPVAIWGLLLITITILIKLFIVNPSPRAAPG